MAKTQNAGPAGSSKTVREAERKKDTSMAMVFFLAIIVVAAIAGAVYEHTEYKQVKSHDDTTSSDNLNGQTPANTEPGGAAAGAANTPSGVGTTTAASPEIPAGSIPASGSGAPVAGNGAPSGNAPATSGSGSNGAASSR